MTDAPKLKPCPFCGSTDLSSGGDDKIIGYWCNNCQAVGPNHYDSRHDWNTRADLSEALVRAGYLAGLEAVSKHLVGIIASHKAMGAHGTYPTLRETTLKSVSTLPIDPEALAAIVARVTEGK